MIVNVFLIFNLGKWQAFFSYICYRSFSTSFIDGIFTYIDHDQGLNQFFYMLFCDYHEFWGI